MNRIPTGIESLDSLIQGGLPAGTNLLLLEEIGAGGFEFAITSIANLLAEEVVEEIHYITIIRPPEDILTEVSLSFPSYHEILQQHLEERLKFKELTQAYFAASIIPTKWRATTTPTLTALKWREEEQNLIQNLVTYLDTHASSNLVIIDSLTALIRYAENHMQWCDLMLFLQGLQRAAKQWKGLIYTLLTKNIFPTQREEEIAETMDTVLVFQWDSQSTQRQRVMYMKKGRGVLPNLEQDNIVNFEIQITPEKGFEVANVKRIRGRI
jgi:KaiC/GvpD/RAD55 family RecA-like ATPase